MKLTTILQSPGIHVWNLVHDTSLETMGDAQKRLQSYLQQDKYSKVRVEAHGALMTDYRHPFKTEPVLIIEVRS